MSCLSIVALVVLVFGIIQGGNTNDWLAWDSLGAILLGLVLLALFVYTQKRSTHPTIDVNLFRNRSFSAGTISIGLTFFALMGSTFYLAYFLQAVRGYTALAAGVSLIAVAAGVMIAAPLSARLSARFGPRIVAGAGLAIFGAAMLSYAFSTRTEPQWIIEIQMYVMGTGMGLTMTPATNSIMSAVPREKAGAGAAVNNTVRQVAGALGVAILGSLLAVIFRNQLGVDRPAQLAATLDQPAAVVSQLPASARVATHVNKDASESIGGALEFAGKAGSALQQRADQPAAAAATPEQVAALRAQAQSAIGGFVDDSKNSFVVGDARDVGCRREGSHSSVRWSPSPSCLVVESLPHMRPWGASSGRRRAGAGPLMTHAAGHRAPSRPTTPNRLSTPRFSTRRSTSSRSMAISPRASRRSPPEPAWPRPRSTVVGRARTSWSSMRSTH